MNDTKKKLGKIDDIRFGFGGYQDAQFGVSITLGGEGWGVDDFQGFWGVGRSSHAEWSEEDRTKHFSETMWWLLETLRAAKKTHLEQLKGVPVEACFKCRTLQDWRILTEVL